MKNLIFILVFIFFVFIISYGTKLWFRYKLRQGKEESNSTIKRGIGALLIGFLGLMGIAPLLTNLLNRVFHLAFGFKFENTQTGEFMIGISYVVFCISIILLIYFYYANRHRLHLAKNDSSDDTKKIITETTKIDLQNNKNVVISSELDSKKDVHIGDKN